MKALELLKLAAFSVIHSCPAALLILIGCFALLWKVAQHYPAHGQPEPYSGNIPIGI